MVGRKLVKEVFASKIFSHVNTNWKHFQIHVFFQQSKAIIHLQHEQLFYSVRVFVSEKYI